MQKNKIKTIKTNLFYIVFAVCCAIGFKYTIGFLCFVPSQSMSPKIEAGSFGFCSIVSYKNEEPKQHDIVVFKRNSETNDKTLYTKRVVAGPNDKVEIKKGLTYINDILYEEPWLKETPKNENYGPFVVPENSYFLMGDNRNNSYDFRFWNEHSVKRKQIKGKITLIFSPMTGIERLIDNADD